MTATPTPLRDTIGHMRDIAGVAERYTVEELRDLLREKADELEAALSARDEAGAVDRRSTHHVHKGPESLPCYCPATMDHSIGHEVATPPASGAGAALLTNPHTGTPRDWRDVEADPEGRGIVKAGEPLRAAPGSPHAWDATGERCTKCGDKDWMGGPCTATPPDGLLAANVKSALGKHYDPEAGIVCSVAFLVAELRRLAAVAPAGMDGWQPIETAPKDGTTVLLYSPDRCGNCPEGTPGIGNARWLGEEWITGRLLTGAFVKVAHQPTHWQPLPTPPATAGKE